MATKESPTIGRLKEAIHDNAIQHGFATLTERRSLDEFVCLIASEVSEALECYREEGALIHSVLNKNGKPEGFPSELADVVIRLLDCAAEYDVTLGSLETVTFDILHAELQEKVRLVSPAKSIIWYLAMMHREIAKLHDGLLPQVAATHIFTTIVYVAELCLDYGIDLENEIIQKMMYNLSRPYKHGKAF